MSEDEADSRLQKKCESSNPVSSGTDDGVLKVSVRDLFDPELHYPMNKAVTDVDGRVVRGHCLLVNQRDFSPKLGQSRRDGTDVDADSVERLFKQLRYAVHRVTNVDRASFERIIHEKATMDHSQFDSFICVILSHGENAHIYTTDDRIPTDAIIGRFRGDLCPSLAGKPKMFFFQACRGTSFDRGAAPSMVTDAVGDILVTKLPVEGDILVAHSTVPGYFAWRNSTCGSWFIQELCRALDADRMSQRHCDLVRLLTVIARCVAYQYRSNTGMQGSHNMTQATSFTSTLTRLVYLTGPPPAPAI